MKGSRYLQGVAAVLMLLVFAAPLSAQANDTGLVEGKTNVQLIFKMGKIENGQKSQIKSYRLIVAEGPVGSKLMAGQRVPFPGDGAEGIVYQNVGFATEARVWMVDKNTIKVVADIEDSRVVPGEGGNPPTVETRQLTVSAVLTEGVGLELTRVEGVADFSGYVELEAKILR